MFEEGAEAAGRNEDELMFFPMNDVPNPTMKWWREDMGPFYRDFAQGMSPPPPFSSFKKPTKDDSSPSVLLWRNAERDPVVEGSILEIPRLLAFQEGSVRRTGQNDIQLPVFAVPRTNYHRVAKRPARAGFIGR